jgi:hypothetical protein
MLLASYDCSFTVQATVIMILNYDRTVIMNVNYNHKTFIVQAIGVGVPIICNYLQ